ncbi:MAG: hypothetical protein ABIQ60_12240 [Burkholderiaceae bacterium]
MELSMQKNTQSEISVDRAIPSQAGFSAESGPFELDLAALEQVAGGSPNGTWATTESPNGTW